MIKINLNNEQKLLNFHYENLTKRIGQEWTIPVRIEKMIKKYKTVPGYKSFYQYLLKKVEKDTSGFSILTARPDQLGIFIKDIETRYSALLQKATIKDQLCHIFYYDDYDKWKAYELAQGINLNVCPYCNRMYTFTVGTDLNKGTRFEYDHFYAKSRYPYLALSFYNLIPSCHVCNSNLKGKNEFDINNNIHPYVEGFSDEIVFSIKPYNIKFINGSPSSYRIKFIRGVLATWDSKKVSAAVRNITTFRLSELYNMHKDYVDEIIQKSIVYNQSYIAGLFTQFQGTLFKNIEDVHRFLLGNYTEEYNYQKRVLSKLTADISRELEII